ncbi:TPA: N-acetyltransferase family protein, partial [Salmonella enterica subsp. enterica serovar Waycross]
NKFSISCVRMRTVSDFSQLPATIKDLPFILDEFKAGSENGNFSKDFLNSKLAKTLEKQLRELFSRQELGDQAGHYFYILARESDGRRVGFIWLMITPDPDNQPILEIRAICITKQFRNKGLGAVMLDEWLEAYPHHPFQAKCFQRSTRTIEMLKRRGFYVHNTSPTGRQLLVRNRLVTI